MIFWVNRMSTTADFVINFIQLFILVGKVLSELVKNHQKVFVGAERDLTVVQLGRLIRARLWDCGSDASIPSRWQSARAIQPARSCIASSSMLRNISWLMRRANLSGWMLGRQTVARGRRSAIVWAGWYCIRLVQVFVYAYSFSSSQSYTSRSHPSTIVNVTPLSGKYSSKGQTRLSDCGVMNCGVTNCFTATSLGCFRRKDICCTSTCDNWLRIRPVPDRQTHTMSTVLQTEATCPLVFGTFCSANRRSLLITYCV